MIEDKRKELIKLISILDNDSDYTELKIKDINKLDLATIEEMLKQVKVLSDYYVKYKLLRGVVPFHIDIDVVNEQSYIVVNNIFGQILISKEIDEIHIGKKLIDNIDGKSSTDGIVLDLTNVKILNFDNCIVKISFRNVILNKVIILNNQQLRNLETKLLSLPYCNAYSLLNITYYILEHHVKQVRCNDINVVNHLKEAKTLLKEANRLTKLKFTYWEVTDTLYEWSKKNNVT